MRLERFGENFRGGRDFVDCGLCGKHRDSQEESFKCTFIKSKIELKGAYENIFSKHMDRKTVNSIMNISRIRREYLEKIS